MRKSRFRDEQIVGFLKQAEAGLPVKELCRTGGFSDATFYKWRARFGGMEASDARIMGGGWRCARCSTVWTSANAGPVALWGYPEAAIASRRVPTPGPSS
jgi:hypothetical protein